MMAVMRQFTQDTLLSRSRANLSGLRVLGLGPTHVNGQPPLV